MESSERASFINANLKKRLIKRYFMYICTRTFKLVKCSEQTFWAQC